jgi:hypothetical protein
MRLLLIFLLLATTALGQVATQPVGDVPPLRVQASVGTSRRAVEGSSFRKTMQIRPKLVVEGASRLKAIPATEATMIVVSMETRAKYVQRQDVYKVASSETLPLPATPGGDRREFNFAETSLTFDADRDRSNVGGEVYKFFICGIRDVATKELVYFYTTDAKLESFCRANPAKREEYLKLRKGVSFPADYR